VTSERVAELPPWRRNDRRARTFEADPEAAWREAVALYGEEVVAAAEIAFDASCLLAQQAPNGPEGHG
jgi:hypothetical protein